MNYAAMANRPNPYAALGALGIPAGIGALLVFGLAVTVVMPEEDDGTIGVFVPIEDPPIEPDPIEPKTSSDTAGPVQQTEAPTLYVPPSNLPLTNTGSLATTTELPNDELGLGESITIAPIVPAIEPVAATPRGNPGGWVTDNDYRNIWITRNYTGTAQFTLSVDASGRVSDCTITGSTGHAALDTATCRLIQRRARFNPARDGNGDAVAGSYSSSIRWTIPE